MRIGIFDSGIGGLTVLREVRRRCVGHATLYLGDTARVPYGTKSPDTVRRYAELNARFLMRKGIDRLVIACNTASAFAMEALGDLPVPVMGVIEPGAELAVRAARRGFVGVLGTVGTVRSGAYERAIRARAPEMRIESIACPLFVPLAEEGWTGNEIARMTARQYLAPWLRPGAERPDAVILGCTHYPLLKALLREELGPEVALIDSAEAVAASVHASLEGEAPADGGEHRIYLTDAAERFVELTRHWLADMHADDAPQVEWVNLDLTD